MALSICFQSDVRTLSILVFLVVVFQSRLGLEWTRPLKRGGLVRFSVRVGSFIYPLLFGVFPSSSLSLQALAIGILIPIPALASEMRNIRMGLSKNFLAILGPISTKEKMRLGLRDSLAGICQEYLYRSLLLFAFVDALGWAAVAFTAFLFVIEHQLHAGASWDLQDIAIHAYLGLALGALCYTSETWWPAVLGHSIFNLPNIVQTLRRPNEANMEPRSSAAPSRPS
ncbi:type II CAAX prenyl endopeptidase Rce1 family protein [Streptomyces sp. NPDC058255]|uniref:CPBP family glutamic-type intramembrane protease n=1 Tax=Streptomyces sp. NPDC058255 TaxID=3346407 RepID=UPI0036F18D05